MTKPILYGALYSVYVRIVFLCLTEKKIPFTLEAIDIFDKDQLPEAYKNLNPFSKIPTLDDNGFILYETNAITHYINDSDTASSLFPTDTQEQARTHQAISILDHYAYPTLVWDIFVEACEQEVPDVQKIADAIIKAKTILQSLEDLSTGSDFLIGAAFSMADIYAIPMFDYFMQSPQGQSLLPDYPRLFAWWQNCQNRYTAYPWEDI